MESFLSAISSEQHFHPSLQNMAVIRDWEQRFYMVKQEQRALQRILRELEAPEV